MKFEITKHPYYASETNYYTNEQSFSYETLNDFLDEWEDADLDMNQVFRFDIKKSYDQEDGEEELDYFRLHVIIIQQRKGIYVSHEIDELRLSDMERLERYLTKHRDNLIKMWKPLI